MSKINQIKKELLQLNGGNFQKMMEAFFFRKYNCFISPTGGTSTENKTKKGTPDILINKNKKYILIECSTQKTELYEKFQKDIDKCLNEKRTKIKIQNIDSIIICYNNDALELDKREKLINYCDKLQSSVQLIIYNIERIAHEINNYYPTITKEYLNMNPDTGQVIYLQDFVDYSSKGLMISQNTEFLYRENEIDNILNKLNQYDLIILHGKPGIGKTRLALEICYRYSAKNINTKILAVIDKGQSVINDLNYYTDEDGDYLLLIDDANDIKDYKYIIEKILENSKRKKIKVIVTVRDYIKKDILNISEEKLEVKDFSIDPISEENIREIIKKNFNIQNNIYLDRILDLSNNNIRIAFMASILAKKAGNVIALYNVFDIYRKYYSPILEKMINNNETKPIIITSIIAFFRKIYLENKEFMDNIYKTFNISSEEFYNCKLFLEENEMIDNYDNKVIKFVDQTFGTYIFYYVFFQKKLRSFPDLFEIYHFSDFMIFHIGQLVMNYNKEAMPVINKCVDVLYSGLEKNDNKEKIIYFFEKYGQIKTGKLLSFLSKEIEALRVSEEKNIEEGKDLKKILNLFSSFRNVKMNDFKIGFELLLKYLSKRPKDIDLVFKIITGDYMYNGDFYVDNYVYQGIIIDVLWKKIKNNYENIYFDLYLRVVDQFLKINRESYEYRSHKVIFKSTIIKLNEKAINLREKMFEELFVLHRNTKSDEIKKAIMIIFDNIYEKNQNKNIKDILESDSECLFPFFKEIKINKAFNCIAIKNILDLWEENNIESYKEIINLDINDHLKIYDVFSYRCDKSNCKIKELIEKKGISELIELLNKIKDIYEAVDILQKDTYDISTNLVNFFNIIYQQSPEDFISIFEHYLEKNDFCDVRNNSIVLYVFETIGANEAYNIFKNLNPDIKDKWSIKFYENIGSKEITKEMVDELLEIYENTDEDNFTYLYHIDFLEKYFDYDKKVIYNISKIVLERSEKNSEIIIFLEKFFNKNLPFINNLMEYFIDLSIVKDIYKRLCKERRNFDYNNSALKEIINLDKEFICEYIDFLIGDIWKNNINYNLGNLDFLWKRSDFEYIEIVIDKFLKRSFAINRSRNIYFIKFFNILDKRLEKRQDEFLLNYIEKNYKNIKRMKLIFSVILEFVEKRKIKFVEEFLKYNKSISDAEDISIFESVNISLTNIKSIENEIIYYKKVLNFCDTAALLEHRNFVNEIIKERENRIKNIEKSNFAES